MNLRQLIIDNPNLNDTEIADLANREIITPKTSVVTFTTLASREHGLGLRRAAEFKFALRAMTQSPDPSVSALADAVIGILDGQGFTPTDAEVPEAVAALVGARIISQDEVDSILYTKSFPFGRNDFTAEDIAPQRLRINRELDVSILRSRIRGAIGTFENESLNAAEGNAALPMPVWNEFIDLIRRS